LVSFFLGVHLIPRWSWGQIKLYKREDEMRNKFFNVYHEEGIGDYWIASFKEGVGQKLFFTLNGYRCTSEIVNTGKIMKMGKIYFFGKNYFSENGLAFLKGFYQVVYDYFSGYWVIVGPDEANGRLKLELGRPRLLSLKLKNKIRKMDKRGRIYFLD
jgi:hypothetical protein